MIKRISLTLLGLHSLLISLSAQSYTISGLVTDAKTSETLISASVFDANTKKGVAANLYGFYSLTLPGGPVQVQYSYVGYAPHNVNFDLTKDTVINVRLDENNLLQEVTIVGNRQELGVQGSQMSAIAVPIAQIKAVPSLF